MALKLGIIFLISLLAQSSLKGHHPFKPFGSIKVAEFLQLNDETPTLLETSETEQSLLTTDGGDGLLDSTILIPPSNENVEYQETVDEGFVVESLQATVSGTLTGVVAVQCKCEKCDHEAEQVLISVPNEGTAVAAVQCSCEECDMKADQSLIALPSDGSAVAAVQCTCEECDLDADQRLISVPNDAHCHCCE